MTEKIDHRKNMTLTHDNKSESTKSEYRRIAEGFIKRELDEKGIKRTVGNLTKALENWSASVRPATFRKIRIALNFRQLELKHYKAAQQIRHTQRVSFGESNSTKQRRCKSITEDEHRKLFLAAKNKGDIQLASALVIGYYLGLRPAEMNSIQYVELSQYELSLSVKGAKKDVNGTRSIDKTLSLILDESEKRTLIKAINNLTGMDKKQLAAMKNRMSRMTRKCFPKRKRQSQITFYCYRHQMASDLKKSKNSNNSHSLTLKQCSAVLSHRSTRSIAGYGHFHSSGGLKRSLPIPSAETVAQVNDNYTESNYIKQKVGSDISEDVITNTDTKLKQDSDVEDVIPTFKISRHRSSSEYTPK